MEHSFFGIKTQSVLCATKVLEEPVKAALNKFFNWSELEKHRTTGAISGSGGLI